MQGVTTIRPSPEQPAAVSVAPPLPPGWVPRERLDVRLDAATDRRLVLVTGPPGSGKTALLSGWSRRRAPGTTAWVALGASDNDPTRLFRHVARALGGLTANLTVTLSSKSGLGATPVPAPQTFRSLPTPVLVVDDVHVLERLDALESLVRLVKQLSAHVGVVLAGRYMPGVARDELSSRGQPVTIDGCDLRFTLDETVALFDAASPDPFPHGQLERILERTDGWATGLRLATLMRADHDDQGDIAELLAAGDPFVADYFVHEVLDGLDLERRCFLLETSVLDELSGPSCRAVSGRPDAEQLLDWLADHHLFITRGERSTGTGTYRYHPLFSQLLRCRLELETPDSARTANRRAAAWFEHIGDVRAAVHHFVLAEAYDEAFTLVSATVERRIRGGLPLTESSQSTTVLPDELEERDPSRLYVLAAAHLCDLRLADAASILRRLTRLASALPERELVEARTEMLWAFRDYIFADPNGVLMHCRRATRLLGTQYETVRLDGPVSAPAGWVASLDAALVDRLPTMAAAAHLWLGEEGAALALVSTRSVSTPADPVHLELQAAAAWQGGGSTKRRDWRGRRSVSSASAWRRHPCSPSTHASRSRPCSTSVTSSVRHTISSSSLDRCPATRACGTGGPWSNAASCSG